MRYMAGIQNPEIAAYIVRWLNEKRALKMSWQAIADEVKDQVGDGVTKQQLIGMFAEPPRIGAGGKTVDVFARFFFDGSIDALRAAAEEHWSSSAAVRARFGEPVAPAEEPKVVVPDHLEDDEDTKNTVRYAIETEKLSQEAVNRVLSRVPGGASGRMPPSILLDQIRAAHNAIKYEQSVGNEEAMRQRGETVVTDELDTPLTDEALAKIKARAAKRRKK